MHSSFVALEPMYTVRQLATLWHIGMPVVRKLFRGRPGIVNLGGNPGKPVWRIPGSLVVEVMVEHGYAREQVLRLLGEG